MKNDPTHQIIDFIEEDAPLFITPHKNILGSLYETTLWHEQLEIKLFYSSGDRLTIGSNVFIAEKDDIFVINSCEPHSASSSQLTDYHMLIIDVAKLRTAAKGKAITELDNICTGKTVFNTRIQNNPRLRTMIEELADHYQQTNEPNDLKCLGLLYMILDELIRNETAPETVRTPKNTLNLAKKLSPAIKIISSEYSRKITLDELAQSCGLNNKYFCKAFNKLTGMTAISYINKLRINKAEILISTTDKQMTEIAELCGFSDIAYFSRKFKEINGYTPSNSKRKTPLK